jgi:hypothetical protein
MKKIHLFALFFLVMSSQVLAQEAKPFRLGLTASPSVAWFKPETKDYNSAGVILGFSYGLVGEFRMGEYYSVSTGLNISHFGGKLEFTDQLSVIGTTNLEREYRMQYLELPVAIKLHTPEIGYFTYYGRFGFATGFNLKSIAKDTYVSGSKFTEEYNNKGNTPLLRAALIVGLGLEYSLGGRTSVFGGFTYNNGFTSNLKGRNQHTNANVSATANYLMLNAGIMF